MNAQEQHEHESLDIITGRRIHQLLWDRRLKQTQLAELLGMQQSGVGKKLRGERAWSLDELHTIASAFGTTVAYLIGESDVSVPPEGFEPSAFCSQVRRLTGRVATRELMRLRTAMITNRRSLLRNGDLSEREIAPVHYLPALAAH